MVGGPWLTFVFAGLLAGAAQAGAAEPVQHFVGADLEGVAKRAQHSVGADLSASSASIINNLRDVRGQVRSHGDQAGTERLRWANDDLFGTDNQFTNGVSYQRFSPLVTYLDATAGTPAVGKILARPLLPEGRGLHFREGWAIAHNMQTPDEIKIRELTLNDVPHMGMVGWSNSFVAFDAQRFAGVEWLVGWAGSATQARPLQRSAHRLTGARRPRGWGDQLHNEPIFNL